MRLSPVDPHPSTPPRLEDGLLPEYKFFRPPRKTLPFGVWFPPLGHRFLGSVAPVDSRVCRKVTCTNPLGLPPCALRINPPHGHHPNIGNYHPSPPVTLEKFPPRSFAPPQRGVGVPVVKEILLMSRRNFLDRSPKVVT